MPKTIIPDLEIRDAIIEMGAEDVYKCYQCGKCMGVCPWYQVDSVLFPVYKIPETVKLGVIVSGEEKEEITEEVEEIFRCVGCDACIDGCPHSVNIPAIVRAIRRILVEYGSFPEELKRVVSNIYSTGNPLGMPKEKRTQWAQGLDIPDFQQDTEFAYFVCCIEAYNSQLKGGAVALAEILKRAGVSFGILQEGSCCGEAIRRAGAEEVFRRTAESNIALFKASGVRKILTTSPHCYSTFKKEYPELGGDFEVIHYTQLLFQLIKEKRIIPKRPLNKRVVYHDPCTLGRQNHIYEEPREILKSIPGIELFEIENFSKGDSLCCGGGGGGLWLNRPKEERMTNIRVKQAFDTGAEILAVACPYCLVMFEDAIKELEIDLQVMSISELLRAAL